MAKEIIHPYDSVRGTLNTFDILNCTYGVKWYNPLSWVMAAIGHTAMVYICHQTGQIMVYESTQTSRKDKRSGVQLRPMREWLRKYPGKVRLRQTIFLNRQSRVSAEVACSRHIKKYRGTAYPNLKRWRWRWFLANAAIDLPWENDLENPDIDFVMFCTMLIGHVFRWCGLVYTELNPAELEPDDTRRDSSDFFTSLYPLVQIGSEIRLK